MTIEKNKTLKQYNSFGVDLIADKLIIINDENNLFELFSRDILDENFYILGGGSNILFVGDFHGIILKNDLKGIKIIESNDENVIIEAGSGEIWHELVKYCIEKNYYGLENLALIPGTVGSAPVQNIGAYGIEQKDYFESLDAFDIFTGTTKKLSKDDCQFGYRTSLFKQEKGKKYFITKVRYKLNTKFTPHVNYKDLQNIITQNKVTEITARDVFDAVCNIRQRKLPDPKIIGNAGSFFKNPIIKLEHFDVLKESYPSIIGYKQDNQTVKLSAAWLIESCGWKGKRIGEAGVYDKHALILVNYKDATGREIFELSEKIRESVLSKFNVNLEREIIIIEN